MGCCRWADGGGICGMPALNIASDGFQPGPALQYRICCFVSAQSLQAQSVNGMNSVMALAF